MKRNFIGGLLAVWFCTSAQYVHADSSVKLSFNASNGLLLTLLAGVIIMLGAVVYLLVIARKVRKSLFPPTVDDNRKRFSDYLTTLDSSQIERFIKLKSRKGPPDKGGQIQKTTLISLVLFTAGSLQAIAQTTSPPIDTAKPESLFGEAGVIITLVLLAIPISLAFVLMVIKIKNMLGKLQGIQTRSEASQFADYLASVDIAEVEAVLQKRKVALDYHLTHTELAGGEAANDSRGLLSNINSESALPIVGLKKRAMKRPAIDPALASLILWYIGCATFWLVFGTTVGEYVGIKFVAPDVDHASWLSFGRLRPVHTNAVFWGWASLAMLGLGHYVVPRVSNTSLASISAGWYTLWLINASVILGTLCLMGGINNGGGEYREYIWPVMLLFAIGVIIALGNFLQTIARRTTKEIYISNWYIVAATIFAIVISIIAYVPTWQDGLGETIIQGYYMHQGVGMWFMLFTLGIVYYFLPQQLNKPIYSYSLGILAFWAQILFYTLIGTHHFVFSSIPWWLQTIAIVGSAGMIIPVAAGTANFLFTFKGAWYKIASSYTLPFFLVGTIFYFTGSLQGSAESFRTTNLLWHFSDFTIAHSHITMYGIVCFFLWAAIYAVVPRLTGREAPQIAIGAHFWLALIGMMFYTIPLMYGGTLRGLSWMEGKPFLESVVLMAPYWLWRAIGGSLMWLSHLFFSYNIYRMLTGSQSVDVREAAIERLNQNYTQTEPAL